MNEQLAGKKALVVGGGTGIGLGIAQALAEAGAHLAISGRRADALRKAADSIRGTHAVLTHTGDVGDPNSVEQLIAWAIEQLGHIDVVFNCAGINVIKRKMVELTIHDWDEMMRINASGAFYVLRSVLPHMRQRKDGLIVQVNSISGKRAGLLGGVGYNASKFAMTGLGITAGQEEAEHGIRITNVYPGEVDTPILEKRPVPVTAEHRARILKPEDFGPVAVMLASLPPRVHIPELIVKPLSQMYV